jgi:hypothetical protein
VPTPNTAKIAGLIDLYPPATAIGTVLLLTGGPASTSASVAEWLTYEISDYQGAGGRKSAVTPASGEYTITSDFLGNWGTCIVPVVFNNTSGASNIVYQRAAMFTPDLSEIIAIAHDGYIQDYYIDSGESKQINFTLRLR